ncbi:Beta-phosphoglucomutase, HAD superfamily [Quadrisphaera granulorum]|uniref:Beta-phosphoglucomutase-like phosphatase (HAD superfamily) n=1 Tax=Quadrisphaera granulorum TaxID=317664 RepID=A0A316A2J7_9ACTN|nr:HAD family hydrolase [Quadrisphaera granulorum]PWJ51799.1 beta-phosphoglucomutase-like phosphatase (HAD superfamily) [Quadrisphaera granulorum]SZE97746.1 Beta-phosphoglucomutase, HAD superfamily [Quadrisphaera granulorum]
MPTTSNGRPDAVLLDVDGTLVDSNYQHVVAWARAFTGVGVDVPAARLHRAVGMGGDQLVGSVAGDDVERAHGDALREAWKREYLALLDRVPVLPGAADLLRACHDRGLAVVLASSSTSDLLERHTAIIGQDVVEATVSAVTTADDVEASKPAGDLFAVAARKVGARRAVAVGDSPWDARSAHAAGMGVALVRSGGFCDDLLRAEAPEAPLYDDAADLVARLDASPLLD